MTIFSHKPIWIIFTQIYRSGYAAPKEKICMYNMRIFYMKY